MRALRRLVPLLLLVPRPASAHVKWFSELPLRRPAAGAPRVLAPTFWALARAQRRRARRARAARHPRLEDVAAFPARQHLAGRLPRPQRPRAPCRRWCRDAAQLAGRRAARARADGAPAWVGWAQFGVAAAAAFRRTVRSPARVCSRSRGCRGPASARSTCWTTPTSPASASPFSSRRPAPRASAGWRLPALFATVGFSLCWVALEKLVYPQWGLYVIGRHPQLDARLPGRVLPRRGGVRRAGARVPPADRAAGAAARARDHARLLHDDARSSASSRSSGTR